MINFANAIVDRIVRSFRTYIKTARSSHQPRPKACIFIKKETLAQVFSCEFCEISKNTFFYRSPLVAASVLSHHFHPPELTRHVMYFLLNYFVMP